MSKNSIKSPVIKGDTKSSYFLKTFTCESTKRRAHVQRGTHSSNWSVYFWEDGQDINWDNVKYPKIENVYNRYTYNDAIILAKQWVRGEI